MKRLFFRLKLPFQSHKGFSLIELSVVVSIAASAAVGVLAWTQPPASTNATNAAITRVKMLGILSAIDSFRAQKKRLPCPADPLMRSDGSRAAGTDYYVNGYGMEDLDTTQTTVNGTTTKGVDCAVSVGAVPIFSLGLDESYINDAWGRRFTYHVASSICGTDAGTESGLSATQSEIIGCNETSYKTNGGNLTVNNGASDLTTSAAYVLVSHGVNGGGAFMPSGAKMTASANVNEAKNSDGDQSYIKADYSSTFDDLVMFKTKNQIESLVNRKNIRNISVADCEANSAAIKSVNLAETATMKSQLAVTNFQQNGANIGDQGLLGIMQSIQSICIAYYGSAAATINGQTWSGAQCPGTANIAANTVGQTTPTYDVATDSCSCYSGAWDGNCTLVAPFVPTDLAGLQLWLDANDATTTLITNCSGASATDGQAVACWKDKSGNTRNATSSNNPVYKTTNFSGKPAVYFDGGTHFFSVNLTFLANTNYTIMVAEQRKSTNNICILGTVYNWSANRDLHFCYRNDTAFTLAQYENDLDLAVPAYTTAKPTIVSGWFSSSSGHYLNYYNSSGALSTSNANLLGLTAANSGRIGTALYDTQGFYNGDIGEIIIYNTALSNADRAKVETYLGAKWGITVP